MKPKAFNSRQKTCLFNHLVLCIGAAGSLFLDTAHAASATWNGGATTNVMNTAGNWTGSVIPNASGDTATFDGTVAGNLSLTWTGGFGASPSGTTISATSGRTGSLLIGSSAINAGSATANTFSLGNVTIASGAGAFTFGDGTDLDNVVFRNPDGTNAINTLTNNSSNTATIASNVRFNSGGGSGRSLIFSGTGNWQVDATWQLGGSGSLSVTKNDSGTLKLTNANPVAIAVPYTINGGALDFNSGAQTTGTITLAGNTAALQNGSLTTGTINANSATGESFVSNITSTGVLNKSAAGTLTLSGTNSFASVSTTGGTVQINGGSTTLAGAFAYSNSGTTLTLTTGSLTVASITANANSDFRNLNLNGGSLSSVGNVFASGTAIAVNFNGGTLKSGSAAGITLFDANNTFEVNAGGATLDTTTGNITTGTNASSVNLVKFNGTNGGTLTVTGGNTFKSAVTNTGALALQGGSTWDMDGGSTVASSVRGLSGTTGTIINSGVTDHALTLAVTSGSPTFGGIISSSGGANIRLLKSGAGDQTLSGNNILTQTSNTTNVGAVTVSGGSLTLSGDNTVTSTQTQGGNLIAVTGGTLALTGTNTLSASSFNNGIIVAFGGILNLNSFANNLGGATTLNMGASSGDAGTVVYTGTGETTALDFSSTSASANAKGIIDQSGTGHLSITGNYTPNGSTLLTIQGSTDGTAEFAGNILDSVNVTALTKQGTGTWTLSGSNSYTGDTKVLGGVLVLAGDSSIVDTGKLVIDGGKVAPTGNEQVGTLFFGDSEQVSGTWGSTSSTATNKNNTYFSGTGVITVGVAGGYSSWNSNVGGQTADEDFNSDGVDNGIAYFMNNTGSITLPGIVGGAVTWTNGGNIPASAYGTQFVVQTSENLVTWTDVSVGGLTTNNDSTLTYTLPTGQGKWFVRLVVTPN